MVSSTKALETWDSFDVRTLSWESDAHLIDNDFVDFEDDVEDDDDCYVGYDVDSDVDVDMEMTAANSPQVKERVSPGGGGRGDLSSRCRTPLVKSVSPFLASQARTGHLGHTPLMASISSAPIDCATSSSSSSSVFVASSSSSSSSVASPSLSIQTPCATRTPTVLRRSNSSCEKEGQIMLAVPNSLKRSLSSSNTPLCQLSGSFQRSPLEDSPLPIAPTPLRSKAFSDAVRGPLSMGSPSIALEDESPLSARPVRRVKRRVRRPTRVARDRGLPFAHAFGCAITIPAICLYS
jgi:hypothetical protein